MSAADGLMLAYAVKLTRASATIHRSDVDALLAVGFAEAAVLDICQVVSYYNYVNRLADGLGVELEDFWEPEELTMTREELAAASARLRGSDQREQQPGQRPHGRKERA